MKTKQEQIDEMENELLAYTPMIDIPFESFNEIATAVHNIGYRKASDVIDEFVERLFKLSKEQGEHGVYTIKSWVENVNTVASEMRQEVEKK